MSIFSTLFSSVSAEPIAAVGNVLDKLFTSDDEKLDKEIIKLRLQQQPALVQAARPFLMWVCGLGFLMAFLINPVLQWLYPLLGAPVLPLEVMMELTLAMLGLAGLRTVEKLKGVSK